MTQRLQHVLQLLLIHRHWQVGDVQVGGVLLLLLQGQEDRTAGRAEVGGGGVKDRGGGRKEKRKR